MLKLICMKQKSEFYMPEYTSSALLPLKIKMVFGNTIEKLGLRKLRITTR